jgi:large subunit ribosomal protein L21
MNYAVIRTGGKQYRVAPGDTIRVEALDAEPGSTIDLEGVLLAASDGTVRVGTPLLAGARVTARVVEQGKRRKILVFKKKRRKKYRRRQGHRQLVTTLEVVSIHG